MSTRAHMTETDKAEVWRRRARGEPVPMIARHMGRDRGTVWKVVTATGGIPPRTPQRSRRELRVGEREELSRGLAMGESSRAMAWRLGRAASTVSREVHRNGGRQSYRAAEADVAAARRRRRPKPGKLALSSALRAEVEAGLQLDWSPKQISEWLKREYSDNPQMQISHETIYVSLYVQGRGSLRAELTKHLRTRRTYRRAKNEIRRQGPKMLPDPIMISERPAEANDRAVPGHWEGDLLLGTPTTAIGTLVERSTRYVMLFTLTRGPRAEAVREGIAASIVKLPLSLRRSLTWDQGAEMSQHQRFTVETGVAIYFCDPGRPWQRGTNENTNGLLRQYFPKNRSLSVHTAVHLNAVARELNGRPRQTLNWMKPYEVFCRTVASTD